MLPAALAALLLFSLGRCDSPKPPKTGLDAVTVTATAAVVVRA